MKGARCKVAKQQSRVWVIAVKASEVEKQQTELQGLLAVE